jgi:hypothetical protein
MYVLAVLTFVSKQTKIVEKKVNMTPLADVDHFTPRACSTLSAKREHHQDQKEAWASGLETVRSFNSVAYTLQRVWVPY